MDLVNYSELYHPLSHHNVACGNDKAHTMPTDLLTSQNKAELVQKGFYDKNALELSEKYTQNDRPDASRLRPLDPRFMENEHMLG